ncbi:pathogenesis-related protein PRMS-like [Pomacea canaliculata]|uniref:pathogenesis-related protein PRMS-like n=1 Tax=Pomacea canaliculata TaxID=400727 RepID=UPI000D737744|nr:pathogenesis-related protein PRMS-like [Pomacea canaliculata]XP_025106232.1 pathogenesis-related protein PRMS-like [Pomacea canaliculata]
MAASCLKLFVLVTVVMAQSVIGLDQAMKDYILGVHNKYRGGQGASNMHSLVWDATLEAEAAQWAGGCRFEHQMKTRGENLAWNSQIDKPETELIDIAMKHFYDEKLRYSYGQRSCGSSSACHYTQLVWAKTRRVGCASRLCTPLANAYNKAWYLVCFYDPKGNWNGEKPFEKGPACSGCSGGTCEANLCVGASDDSSAGKPCEDTNPSCSTWASNNQCVSNPVYMKSNCAKSCGICGEKPGCQDQSPQCAEWAKRGECASNPAYMNTSCAKSCGKC